MAKVVEAALGTIAGLLLSALLAMVLVSVVLRYAFHTGFIGVEELCIWLHVALIAAAAPLGLDGPLAMRMDLLSRRLPERWRFAAADTFSIVAGLVFLFGGREIVALLGGISPALGLPEWIRFGFLGASGLMVIVLLALQRLSQGRGLCLTASFMAGTAIYLAVPLLSVDTGLPASLFLVVVAGLGLLSAAPLPHAFLAAAYVAIAFGGGLPEPAIVSTTVAGMSKFLLLAIPFFLLAGGLLTASGAAGRLVRFAETLVGHRRAGLAQTTLLTSVFFSGASGSSVANAAFGASTFFPELVRKGYAPQRAGAIVAATSVLDNVIPPSIAFLLLAAATHLSVGSLLVGGFFAGGLMALCLAFAIHFSAGKPDGGPRASAAERRQALAAALPALGLGIIVVAGIRFGIVTTTEAAAVAATYTLLLSLAASGRPVSVFATFRQAAVEAAAIGLLIGTAAPFAFLLALDDIAGLVSRCVSMLGGGAFAVLLLSNLVLLAAGLVLDIGAAILLLGPILLPAAVAAGIDPVQFGVIVVVNLMIHGLTPPIGILVYVVSGITRVSPTALFGAVLPYLAALLFALFVLCAFALLS
ncbi:TRAP transporter large permease subunit [Mycoplana rhizolycopersici]|uniref:TRAP transporter large permease subunit n=1 Tax=Mycoplana rhizolycopersici TaxID=2746702 RepID=A0ABX2Q8M1_9HYPH|nr:TRAP transporter large permease subunit [Rhizobium rhizolycopersici]NVP53970.1 TRAP transporter large permease subunit [Rhizobium rhizolycopersici]